MCKNHFPIAISLCLQMIVPVEAEKLLVEFQFPTKYNKTLIKPIHQTAHSLASK